ncbi:MAG: hypothetical protein L3J15_05105 [Devosiaceae bacterium]|nr:hypothetical protein [Devosiaceae bacterium]
MSLEQQFDQAMLDIYLKAKSEAKYKATLFFKMLNSDRGIITAKKLINSKKPSDGYTALYEKNCLHLTVEALLIDNPKWHELFEESEIKAARKRLKEYGYDINKT